MAKKKSTKKNKMKAAPRKKMTAPKKKAVSRAAPKKALGKAKKAPARPAAKAKKAPAAPKARKPAAPPLPKGLAPQMPWITPYLTVRDVGAALAFYGRAFGFKERFRMPGPGGTIMHAEVAHNSGVIMIGPEDAERGQRAPGTLGGTPARLYVYCENVDALHGQATAAGAQSLMPPTDMFWGDRAASVVDPEGHSWMFATFKRMVTPEELAKALQGQQGQ